MKKAYHVASGKLIEAEDAEYNQYYGIFQCPDCKAIVSLRAGYTTSNGKTISASFVHPESADQNCSLRENWQVSNPQTSCPNVFSLSKGQKIKYLNKYLLKAITLFQNYNDRNITTSVFDQDLFLNNKMDISSFTIETKQKIRQKEKFEQFNNNYHSYFSNTYSFYDIYLYPQSQKLLYEIAQIIIEEKNKNEENFIKFSSCLERISFFENHRELVRGKGYVFYLYPPFDAFNYLQIKYNIKNSYKVSYTETNIIIKPRILPSLETMIEKHCQIFKDICLLLPQLQPQVIQDILKVIVKTDKFDVLMNKYNNYVYDSTFFDNKDIKIFFKEFYENKLESEKLNFIKEFTYFLLENLFYIDWLELLCSWQLGRNIELRDIELIDKNK